MALPAQIVIETTSIATLSQLMAAMTPVELAGFYGELKKRYPSIPWLELVGAAPGMRFGSVIQEQDNAADPNAGTFTPIGAIDSLGQPRELRLDVAGRLKNVPRVSDWTLLSAPAAATVASAVKGAAVGVRHVLTHVTFSAGMGANPMGAVGAVVLDGAAEVLHILFACPANDMRAVVVPLPSGIVGSVNTSMTVQFTGAPPALGFQAVVGTGYDLTASD